MSSPSGSSHGWVAFSHAGFRNYWVGRVLARLSIDMLITGVSWQVYKLTGDPFSLGLVGLVQFLPFVVLFLPSGVAADRFRRVRILQITVLMQVTCALTFLVVTATGNASLPRFLLILIVLGCTRAFQEPANAAITPLLVPPADFGNAVAWQSMGIGVARISGPAAGGALLIIGEEAVYATTSVLLVIAMLCIFLIPRVEQAVSREPLSLQTILAGFRFIWSRQILLGAISLDLFAVLLGGATALLPIFAVDILGVGEVGFGALRAAHVIGSLIGSLYLTQRPIRRGAGKKLLVAVGLFGLSICVFGLSTTFWLSFVALLTLGAADAFSVVIRNNLVQIVTPDPMRGRVSSVTSIFIGASNELGEFESGVTAAWWGVVPAVLVGGLGTVVIAAVFALLFPRLRDVDTLDPDDLVRRYRNDPAG